MRSNWWGILPWQAPDQLWCSTSHSPHHTLQSYPVLDTIFSALSSHNPAEDQWYRKHVADPTTRGRERKCSLETDLHVSTLLDNTCTSLLCSAACPSDSDRVHVPNIHYHKIALRNFYCIEHKLAPRSGYFLSSLSWQQCIVEYCCCRSWLSMNTMQSWPELWGWTPWQSHSELRSLPSLTCALEFWWRHWSHCHCHGDWGRMEQHWHPVYCHKLLRHQECLPESDWILDPCRCKLCPGEENFLEGIPAVWADLWWEGRIVSSCKYCDQAETASHTVYKSQISSLISAADGRMLKLNYYCWLNTCHQSWCDSEQEMRLLRPESSSF